MHFTFTVAPFLLISTWNSILMSKTQSSACEAVSSMDNWMEWKSMITSWKFSTKQVREGCDQKAVHVIPRTRDLPACKLGAFSNHHLNNWLINWNIEIGWLDENKIHTWCHGTTFLHNLRTTSFQTMYCTGALIQKIRILRKVFWLLI